VSGQDQGLDPFGRAQGRTKRQEAALGVACESRPLDTEMVKQAKQIVSGIPVGVQTAVVLRAAVQRSSHTTQRNSLCSASTCAHPHVAIHEVAVTEDDHRPVTRGVLEVQLLTIH